MQNVLADTGVWYALFDRRDAYFEDAKEKADYLDLHQVVVPWPVLYETLGTRFVKNSLAVGAFERYLKKPHISFLDDGAYREQALRVSLDSSLRHSRPLSLVDCAIRLILEDVDVKIDYLATFNKADFADVCRKRRIEMI
jgi:predicted nucleic acid-binding protein